MPKNYIGHYHYGMYGGPFESKEFMFEDPYKEIAYCILRQALVDYKDALDIIFENYKGVGDLRKKRAYDTVHDCERFFKSDLCRLYNVFDVDINEICTEIKNTCKYNADRLYLGD